MIGFYNYTVLLTYLGFSSSVLGIILAMTGHTFAAIFCLMFSGLCLFYIYEAVVLLLAILIVFLSVFFIQFPTEV